jgi:large subunit ribosomal protein L9
MPSTEIILTENIPGLGAEADVVKVRRGYARNFLLPQGKAYEVTKRSLRQLDNLKAKRAAREAAELNEAEELSRRIAKLKVVFTLETGETGKAFGSVTAQDLVKRLKNELGNEIDRHRVMLEHPLKTTGEHEVSIKLHHDVTAKFIFQIKSASEDASKGEPAVDPGDKTRGIRKRREET